MAMMMISYDLPTAAHLSFGLFKLQFGSAKNQILFCFIQKKSLLVWELVKDDYIFQRSTTCPGFCQCSFSYCTNI